MCSGALALAGFAGPAAAAGVGSDASAGQCRESDAFCFRVEAPAVPGVWRLRAAECAAVHGGSGGVPAATAGSGRVWVEQQWAAQRRPPRTAPVQQVQWTVTDPATGDTTLCEAGYRNGVLGLAPVPLGVVPPTCSRAPRPRGAQWARSTGGDHDPGAGGADGGGAAGHARPGDQVPRRAAEFGAVVGLPVRLRTPAAQWEAQIGRPQRCRASR